MKFLRGFFKPPSFVSIFSPSVSLLWEAVFVRSRIPQRYAPTFFAHSHSKNYRTIGLKQLKLLLFIQS